MATGGNSRDVELAIGVSTTGAEAVAALRTSVEGLAKSGGDAAPEFTRLAAELDKIGNQQDVLAAFSTLRRDVAELGTALDQASTDVDRFGAQLAPVRANAETFAQAQREAADTVKATKASLEEARVGLVALREEYPKGSRNTDDYRIASGELQATVRTLTAELRGQKAELATTTDGAKAAAAAERTIARAYDEAVASARQLSAELGRQNTALDESRASLDKAGLSAGNLAFSQEIIRVRFADTRAEIEKHSASLAALTIAQERFDQEQRLAAGFAEAASRSQREAAAAESQRVASIRTLTTAIQQQGAATQTALDKAFGATGVRSAQAIDAEIRNINQSLLLISQSAKGTGADFDRAFTAAQVKLDALQREAKGLPATMNAAAKSTTLLGDAIRQAAIYFSAFTVGKEFIDANAQLETLRRSLTIVTGSAKTAGEQIAFLRKTADDSGVALQSITGAYGRFAASAVAAGVDLKTVNRTFADVTKAAGLLGLSSDEVGGALNALGQIASKGKVSMEELGQQLGDRLPAVLATTAKGLGITTSELTKLIQSGEILGDANFFRAFAAGIEETFLKGQGRVEGLNASIGRLKNAFNDLFTGEEGRGSAVAAGIDLITVAVQKVSSTLSGLGDAIGGGFAAISNFVSTLQQGAGPLSAFNNAMETLNDSYTQFLLKAPGIATLLGQGTAAQIAAAIEADKLAKAQTAAGDAAIKGGQAQITLADGTKVAAGAADLAASGYTRLLSQYLTIREATAAAAAEAEKLAHAKKIETDQTVELAKATGDEEKARITAVGASVAYAVALENVATLRTREAALLTAEIDALRAEAIAHGGVTDAVSKQLVELQKKQVAAAAEAEKSIQQAEAAKNEANARKILAETYQDNSKQLDVLTKAATASTAALKEATAAFADGKITAEAYGDVQRKNAEAQALFRDALKDTVEMLKAKAELDKANVDVLTATLNVQKAALQAEIDVAKARGDEFTVTVKMVELKQIEIKIIEAKAAAQKAEALASIAVAEATRAELAAESNLTDVKKLQIDATIKLAQVKQLEADAMLQGTKVLQQQINNLQTYGKETLDTAKKTDDLRGATDKLSGSMKQAGADATTGAKGLKDFAKAADEAVVAAGSLSSSLDARNKSNMSVLKSNQYDKEGNALDSSGNLLKIDGQIPLADGQQIDTQRYQRDMQQAILLGGKLPDPKNYITGPGGTNWTDLTSGDNSLKGNGTGAGSSPFNTYGGGGGGGGGGTPGNVSYHYEDRADGRHLVDDKGNDLGIVGNTGSHALPGQAPVPGSGQAGSGLGTQPVTINIPGMAPTKIDVGAGQAGVLADLLTVLTSAKSTAGGR